MVRRGPPDSARKRDSTVHYLQTPYPGTAWNQRSGDSSRGAKTHTAALLAPGHRMGGGPVVEPVSSNPGAGSV